MLHFNLEDIAHVKEMVKGKDKYGVFDFDGTILDTMPAYFSISSMIIEREYGISGAEYEAFSKNYTGMPMDETLKWFLTAHGRPTDRIAENLDAFFRVVDAQEFPLIEGAEETVRTYHQKGYRLFVSTGSQTARTKERLKAAGLLDCFELVYGSSELEKGPAHIEDFARRSGVSFGDFTRRAFFLGDGPGDMKLAKTCAMKAVGVAHTFDRQCLLDAGADIVLGKIREAEDMELVD